MSKLKKRRAVSVVIASLLILAITAIGAVMISNMISSSSIASISQTSRSEIASNSLALSAYDTRDGPTLSSISSLNNDFDNVLCTITCTGSSRHNVPTSLAGGGTDFIVIQVRNNNIFEVAVNSIQVNSVTHDFDPQTSGVIFNANFDDTNGKYPRAGMFSFIPVSNLVTLEQQPLQNIQSGDEVRIVIKLSDTIQQDIGLGDSLHVLVNLGTPQPAEYLFLAGDTR
jgi:hypothetical protein